LIVSAKLLHEDAVRKEGKLEVDGLLYSAESAMEGFMQSKLRYC
jgi:hypothetical protein